VIPLEGEAAGGDDDDWGAPADELGLVEPKAKRCACRIEPTGLVHRLCRKHEDEFSAADWKLRQVLDAELDARIRELFGDRRFERSNAIAGNFAVKRG